jgi:hypothetical protein
VERVRWASLIVLISLYLMASGIPPMPSVQVSDSASADEKFQVV